MNGAFEGRIRRMLSGDDRGLSARLLTSLLAPPSAAYAAVMRLRARLYAAGLLESVRLPRPVISIGNLAVGGTGKTPAAALVASWFLQRGKRPALLSRGYGGKVGREPRVVSDGTTIFLEAEEAGDEPLLLARSIPGLIVVVGSDRAAAGQLALEKFSPDLFILDDGFQHLRLQRDLDILLFDAKRPFGNGRTFPGGLLREPLSAASRAGVILVTRSDGSVPPAVTRIAAGKPVVASSHELTGLVSLQGGPERSFATMTQLKGLAFAGIADPSAFFASLRGKGLRLSETISFPDHTQYGKDELDLIREKARQFGTDFIVTTEKDAVKLAPDFLQEMPIFAGRMRLLLHDSGGLTQKLSEFL